MTIFLVLILFIILFGLSLTRRNFDMFFYLLSGGVALVGINAKFFFTIYISRLIIISLLVGLLIRLASKRGGIKLSFDKTTVFFIGLFLLILSQHLVSVILSERIEDGLRQVLIYTSVMLLFILVLSINANSAVIIKGLKIFLAIGLVQGLYGIYQVIGGPHGLPTYQSIMGFIPTSGDKTIEGFLFSGALQLFRATGFIPGDVNNYGVYMACIIVLTLSFMMVEPASKYLKVVFFVSCSALILSFSRSALVALALFGLPTLLFLTVQKNLLSKMFIKTLILYLCGSVIFLIVFGPIIFEFMNYNVSHLLDVVSRRLMDLSRPGVDPQGSMSIHILTRLLAVDAFLSNPVFGVGLGVNASPWFSETFNQGWAGAHSHHFDILGQTGIFGSSLEWFFMVMVCCYVLRGLRLKQVPFNERVILAGLFSIIILIIFGSFFYHFFLNDFVWYLLAAATGLSRAMLLKHKITNTERPNGLGQKP